MRYLAIRYFSGGFHAIIDNMETTVNFHVINMETIDQTRQLYQFLNRNGYIPDEKGVIHVKAFGVCAMELLTDMYTLPRYVCFEGGLLNPNLLYIDKRTMIMPEHYKVEEIVEMVRDYFRVKTSKNKKLMKGENVIQKIDSDSNNPHKETHI